MSYRSRIRLALQALALCACLATLASACGGQGGNNEEPPALSSTDPDPELRTYQPSPSQQGEEQSVTIRQGSQKRAAGLRIAVSATRDGQVRFTVSEGPGIDKDNPEGGRGTAGDTVTLDNGYTITIEEVQDSAEDDAPGAGSGSTTLTITPPE